jgi:CcmD family protein
MYDDMNRNFLIAAFSVMWIVVLGYMLRLVVRGSRARAAYQRMVHGSAGEER